MCASPFVGSGRISSGTDDSSLQQQPITGWRLCNLPAGVNSVHGIPTTAALVPAAGATAVGEQLPHPNGTVSVDHIVFQTPDADTSISELARVGIKPIRETSKVRKGVRQVIFRPSEAIIELVQSKNTADHLPRLFGLTLVTVDVDKTH
eukprot:SAG31_NODE_7900_length_1569_cov_4.458503_2_plen_148_part_01